ncbi:MAG: phage head closure protein [Sulfitobacter sp.]|jgi:SPP1 family predicted phage head-tail adaptor
MSVVEMNRKLVLEKPARQADGAGGYEQSWVPVGVLWAHVAARTGREAVQGGVLVSRVDFVITVRGAPAGNPARPVPQQRFREGSRVFHIKSVAERDTQGRYLICRVKEETVV